MKTLVTMSIVPLLLALCGCASTKAVRSDFGRSVCGGRVVYGYRIQENQVVFEFRPECYTLVKTLDGVQSCLSNVAVDEVCVAGQFNSWSTNNWPMTPDKDGRFALRRDAGDFTGRDKWQFTFVVNRTFWVEPPGDAANMEMDLNDANRNLVLRIPRTADPAPPHRSTVAASGGVANGIACGLVEILLYAPGIVFLCL